MTSVPKKYDASLARHRVPLQRGWTLWRDLFLRSAGFPVALTSPIVSDELVAAADALIEAVDSFDQAFSQLRSVYTRIHPQSAASRLSPWRMAKRLRGESAPAFVRDTLNAMQSAETRRDARLQEYQVYFNLASVQASIGLRALARLPAMQEAIIWQNRRAFVTAVVPFLRRPIQDRSSNMRRKERLIAQYAMRYSLKTDTIGFFGPHSWGTFTAQPDVLSLHVGSELLASREVFFEHWCIDALASQISESANIKPWLTPRLSPLFRLEGSTLHRPLGNPIHLDPLAARALAACDGRRPAKEVAAVIVKDNSSNLSKPDDTYDFLTELVKQGYILWTLETPNINRHPEHILRKHLENVTDEAARLPALASLTELEIEQEKIRNSAGDAESLNKAIERLETTFTRLTKQQATRRPGQVYAGRTLVYEECRRNVTLEFGKEFLDRLGSPLSLLLSSTRWFTYHIAKRYRSALSRTYREMAREEGSASVDFLKFHFRASPLFPILSSGPKPPTPPIITEVLEEFQSKWTELLAISVDKHVEERSAARLSESIETAFSAPCPGWPSARYHSPDIMVAASGADAVRRGDYFLVLSELHAGLNTLETPLAFYSHPAPDQFVQALLFDIPGPRVAPAIPKDRATRVALAPFASNAIEILFDSTLSSRAESHTIPASELVIKEAEQQLMVCTRDDKRSWDIIAFYDLLLCMQSVAAFEIFPSAPHWPRVILDDLVISRETWRFKRSEIPLNHNDSSQDHFLSARRWARSLRMPRFVFFRVSGERKPMYLDFESPVAVGVFANMLHRCEDVVISEMLPVANQCWLTDSSGNAYASEIRTVAVDPEPWRHIATA